jgi:hypothetical protein
MSALSGVARFFTGNDCYGCDGLEIAHPEREAARGGKSYVDGAEFVPWTDNAQQVVATCSAAMSLEAERRGVDSLTVDERHLVCNSRLKGTCPPELTPVGVRLAILAIVDKSTMAHKPGQITP